MSKPYLEDMKIGNTTIQVYANNALMERKHWSIDSMADGMRSELGSMDSDSLEKLKRLRDLIDGAIEFFNDDSLKNNDKRGETNDESEK